MKNKDLLNYENLYNNLIASCEKIDGKSYIFLDEIQAVDSWEKVVSSLLVDLNCDIYITGSNSKLITRNKVNDINLLKAVLSFLMDNIANPFSARSIVSALAAGGIKTTVETIIAYIDYIKKAMILCSAQRYDIKGKKLLTTNEKYYSVDLGLRNCIKSSNQIDYNKLYENIIYLELLYRGYEVKVGKTDDYEIDFIAYKGKEILYFQVCYLLSSPSTIEREFGNLEKLNDNYPKYVISADLPDFSHNGIKHYNIIDFLLGKIN